MKHLRILGWLPVLLFTGCAALAPERATQEENPGRPGEIISRASSFSRPPEGRAALRQGIVWPRLEPERDTDAVLWVPTKTGATAVRSAFDGTQWLVVWQDARSGVPGIYGMRVAADGTRLDPIGFPISVRSTSAAGPVVAHNGTHFLVAWVDARNQASDIYGARVDASGRVLDPHGVPLVVSASPKGSLALASDGQDFLLAFTHSLPVDFGLYATRISASTVPLDPQGFPVFLGSCNLANVSWTGLHYLIVYTNLTAGFNVSASRVRNDGTVLDPNGFQIFWGSYYNSMASVASSDTESLAVYYTYNYWTGNMVRAVRVDNDANRLDNPHLNLSVEYSPRYQSWFSTTTTYFNDRYLVAWYDYHVPGNPATRALTADLYANVVFPDGSVMYPEGVPVLVENGHQLASHLAAGGPGALLTFVDQARTVSDVRALRLDENALPVGESFYVNVSGNAQYLPQLAAGRDAGGNFQMLAAWQDDRGADRDVYAARLDENAQTLDASAIPVAVAPGEQIPSGAVFSGGRYWVAWTDERGGDRDVHLARILPDGQMEDAADATLLAGGAGDQDAARLIPDGSGGVWLSYLDRALNPAGIRLLRILPDRSVSVDRIVSDPQRTAGTGTLAPIGTGVLVAWQSLQAGSWRIEATRLDENGQALWGPVLLDPVPDGVQLRPAAASNGNQAYVVWEDNRNLAYQIHGAIVDANGAITPSAGALAASVGGQYFAHVLHDGSHFVVSWEEEMDTGSDIRAMRVDASGIPVDSQAAIITQSPVAERTPQAVAVSPRTMLVAYGRILPESPYGAPRIRVRRAYFNRPPEVPEHMAVTIENTPVELTLSASDAEGDELSFSIEEPPASGALAGDPPRVTYTPQTGFAGEDGFLFRVSDGFDEVLSRVRIVVVEQGQRPVALSAAVATDEDTPVDILLQAQGATPLSYEFMNLPQHGRFKGTPPDIQYNPDADYHGPDLFTFRVSDGLVYSDVATVLIDVRPVNDPPIAVNQELQTAANQPFPVLLEARDVDRDPLQFEIVEPPRHGSLQGIPPLLQYRPHKNFVGEDSFTFSVSDGQARTIGTVQITVENTLRRELDGDASWGCRTAPGGGSHEKSLSLVFLAILLLAAGMRRRS